jgi:hypothetical protein
MERFEALMDVLVLQAVLGWPIFAVGEAGLIAVLRATWSRSWMNLLLAAVVALPLMIICALVIWTFGPHIGPMYFGFVHWPAVVAVVVVVPIAIWWFRRDTSQNSQAAYDA